MRIDVEGRRRKTEAEVGGQCKCGLEGEGTVGRGDAKPDCVEATCQKINLTTNLAACVCQCAKFDQFLPARSHFGSKRPENFVRIAKFPYAAFRPLFAFHCPLFFTRNNDLECKSSRFAAVDRRSVADKQLHLNGVIHSAGVAQCQELSAKT